MTIIRIVWMFYNIIIYNVLYISLQADITPRINVSCGIRQGCPILPKLFIICTQLLANFVVNNKDLEGIKVCDTKLIISQFADDTVIFLKDKSILQKALNVICFIHGITFKNVKFYLCIIALRLTWRWFQLRMM